MIFSLITILKFLKRCCRESREMDFVCVMRSVCACVRALHFQSTFKSILSTLVIYFHLPASSRVNLLCSHFHFHVIFQHLLSPFFVKWNKHAHMCTDTHRHDNKRMLFVWETVCTSNETKCGQAEGQVNETATESLAVFDLPPLIQRDHLIN